MKTLKASLLTIFFFTFFTILPSNDAKAQEIGGSRSQSVYMEFLGNGLTYSLNYDTRFSNSHKGLGGRVGIGYISLVGNSLTSVPIVANYLFGQDKHYFEVGAGATLLAGAASVDFGPGESRARGTAFIGTMSLGYRLEPQDGGFLFRAGVTPIFDRSSFFPFWPQISFGYSF